MAGDPWWCSPAMPLFRGCVERLSLHAPPQFAAWPAKYYSILNQTQSPAGRQQIWILLRALQFRCSSLESGALLMSACMRSAKHSRWRSTAAEPREVQATNAPSRPANGHASNAGKGTWINPQAARSISASGTVTVPSAITEAVIASTSACLALGASASSPAHP